MGVSKIVKFIESENGMVVAGGWKEREMGSLINRY